MRFSNPSILYLLILVPFLYVVLLGIGKKRLREKARLGKLHTLNKFSSKDLMSNFRLESLFVSFAFLFYIIALSRPQAGTRLEPVKITGSLQGDRVGLILFAGDAFVQCPLTTDYDAVVTFINSLDSDAVVSGGTSLFAPLEVALKSISPEEDKYSILLLLTDGENTKEINERVLKDLQQRGIKVFSVGIGTKRGAPIPLYDEVGRRVGYKKDSRGKVVISRLSDDLLKEIAEKTKGYYFEAGAGLNEIGRFLSTVNAMKKRELETKKYTVYEERFQIPLGIGILFLLLYAVTAVKTKRESI